MNKLIRLAALAACMLLLCGCWDSIDIQQENIHISEVIDYQHGKYHFFGEVATLSGGAQKNGDGGQNKMSFSIIKASGETHAQARDNLNLKSSKPVYLGACEVLIFTDRLASKGVEEYLNRSRTQRNTRKSLKVITTSSEPEELLSIEPDNAPSVGLDIDNMQESMTKDGSSFYVNIGDLLETLAVKKASFLIPAMDIEDSHITLTGYTVFKNAKKIGFIPQDKRRGVVFFLNPKGHFHYEVVLDSNWYDLDVTLKDKNINTLYSDGQLTVQVQFSFNAVLNYTDVMHSVTKADRESLQYLLEEAVRQDIVQALETSQEYAADYLGIYRHFRAQHNSAFQTINWEQVYSSAKTQVTTDVAIIYSELPQEP
ncbi:MAG: Ger(x)C family spore germination protein [Christensenellales bacterium]|jgi:spore germination protein KC